MSHRDEYPVPSSPASTSWMRERLGFEPLPYAPEEVAAADAQRRTEQGEALSGRVRTTIACAALGMAVSTFYDATEVPAMTALALYGSRAAAFVVFAAVSLWHRQEHAMRWPHRVLGAMMVAMVFCCIPTIKAICVGDAASVPQLMIVEMMGLATFFPWGVVPQLAFVIAAFAQFAVVHAIAPDYPFTINSAIALGAAAVASIYIAASFDRQRLVAILTARRRQQQADAERELAEQKSRFVSQTSHEFRTPLAVISTAADALRRYAPRMTPDQHARRCQKILDNVELMTDLLDDVLAFGRSDSGAVTCVRERADVRAMCEQVLADVRATAKATHELVLSCALEGEAAWLDPKLTRQILHNLVSNAVKYSPDGGRVELSVAQEGELLSLRVSDSGIGIAPEDQAKLFEAFQRGHNVGTIPGTGLGLAITHKAVSLHGGAIAVKSAVGQGTTFTVQLPAAAPTPIEGPPPPDSAES